MKTNLWVLFFGVLTLIIAISLLVRDLDKPHSFLFGIAMILSLILIQLSVDDIRPEALFENGG